MGNAISQAQTPTVDFIREHFPSFTLQASGIGVGLPWGEEGNSEVGHLNLGAGKIVYQYLPRIIGSIRDGSFFKNPALLKAMSHVKQYDSTLHIMGLISSGSVHSYIDHLYALLDMAQQEQLQRVVLHLFTDGKDSPPTEGARIIENLVARLEAKKQGRIGSLMGRSFAMDRNHHWEFTRKAYELLVQGKGERVSDPVQYLRTSYRQGKLDSDVEPAIIVNPKIVGAADELSAAAHQLIKDNDSVIFFNFREDSARQLTKMFVLGPGKEDIPAEWSNELPRLHNLIFTGMTTYQENLPIEVAFRPEKIDWPLARVLSENGYAQLHIAETEKYAHITYFFNGEREEPFPGEERILVPSKGTPHYDQFPEMEAQQITQIIEEEWHRFDCVIINYANADVLGHTGNLEAAEVGIATIDSCIRRLFDLTKQNNAYLFLAADHGNAERMRDPRTGAILTQHTMNPVMFSIIAHNTEGLPGVTPNFQNLQPNGLLSDVAPTILTILHLPLPGEMTGKNLLQ